MMIDVMLEASLTDKSKLEIKGENGFKYAMKNLSRKNNLKSISNLITKTSITNI